MEARIISNGTLSNMLFCVKLISNKSIDRNLLILVHSILIELPPGNANSAKYVPDTLNPYKRHIPLLGLILLRQNPLCDFNLHSTLITIPAKCKYHL
jgi:hypothetical protein